MKDRIRELMEAQHMNQQTFSNCIGINTATLSGILTGRTQPTIKVVNAIMRKFPNININWLMFGQGGMIASNNPTPTSQPSSTDSGNENLSQNHTHHRQQCRHSMMLHRCSPLSIALPNQHRTTTQSIVTIWQSLLLFLRSHNSVNHHQADNRTAQPANKFFHKTNHLLNHLFPFDHRLNKWTLPLHPNAA